LAIQIADALEAAHSKELFIAHIKPANILSPIVTRRKVLDFGLAKQTLKAEPCWRRPQAARRDGR